MGSTEQMFHSIIEVDADLKTSRSKDTYTQHAEGDHPFYSVTSTSSWTGVVGDVRKL